MFRPSNLSIFNFDMIKAFITRVCLFVAAGLMLLYVLSCLHLSFIRMMLQPAHLSIGKDADVIIMGDSHTQTGIDESLLRRSVNVSANSMHYLYSYVILKALLPSNPRIKAVVLGYSYHNLNEYYDGMLLDGDKARFKLVDHYALFGRDEEHAVRAKTLAFYEAWAKYHFGLPIQINPRLYCKALCGPLTARDLPFWGKTYSSKHSNISRDSLIKTLERHFYRADLKTFQDHSDLQKRYLEKIIAMCRSRGVRLHLLITPLHPAYRSNIPEDFNRKFRQFTSELENKYPDLTVWDHANDRYADFMYGDADHLNVYGAQIFTRVISRRLDELRAQGFGQ